MDVQVANPKMLLLIWLVPAVVVWWYHLDARRERALRAFMSDALQKRLRPAASRLRFRWQVGLLCTGLTLALVSAARPQWGSQEEKVFQRGRDLIVALDVSRSMLATDVRPNRLQRAKTDLIDLVSELKGDRAALLAFRSRATLLCPLTTDYAYFRQALEGAGPDSAPRGETDIGAAIREALQAFDSEGGAHKAIILITDGEDLAGTARAAAEEAAKRGVVIFTVGLGSREGATIPDPQQGSGATLYRGEPVRTKLDNATLHDVATLTHGAYVPVETAGMTTTTLGTLYRDHLRNITEQDIEESLQRRYVERYQWFLFPGVLCLLAAAALSRGRLAARKPAPARPASGPATSAPPAGLKDLTPPPRPLKAIALFFAVLSLALSGSAVETNEASTTVPAGTNAPALPDLPPGRSGARVAQRLFQKGDYAAAAQAYLAAAQGATETSQQDFRYNAAVALYRDGKFKEAAEILRELAQSPGQTPARIPMGMGTALFHAADALKEQDAKALRERATLTHEAAEAFRLATRASPGSNAARQNAAVAVQALPEREDAAHLAEILAKHQGADPGRLAADMLLAQRDINAGIEAASTNASPSRIHELESLATRQRDNADLWIPLKGLLMQAQVAAGTNGPANPAELAQVIELTRDGMLEASRQLRDLDPAAASKATMSEATIYRLWKATAGYAELLREDLWRQTNAIAASRQPESARRPAQIEAEQREARELTDLFTTRFEQQVPAPGAAGAAGPSEGTSPPGQGVAVDIPPSGTSTNIDRAKILELSAQAKAVQDSALSFLGTGDLEESQMQQELSYKILKEIEALLPKSQSSQQQQQDQKQPSDQKQQSSDQSKSKQDQQSQSQADQSPAKGEKPPEPKEQQAESPKEDEKKDGTPVNVQRLLERALEREREHEAEQRQKQEFVPLSPTDRDW
ncbi:MAG: VWA domain-containing protein [Lentisphaerae bacterium]|nr:VWA domain-containing protein [Lentisphaerota bacterium]